MTGELKLFGNVTPDSVGIGPLTGRLNPPPGLLCVDSNGFNGVTPGLCCCVKPSVPRLLTNNSVGLCLGLPTLVSCC